MTTNDWTETEFDYDIPRWNHASHMYAYPPAWKYFVFGGSTGIFDESVPRNIGRYTNSLHVFDVEGEGDTWSGKEVVLEIEEEMKDKPNAKVIKPNPRDSCGLVFNEDEIVIFGGWNNNWYDDMWSLNTSKVTGPKYAIY